MKIGVIFCLAAGPLLVSGQQQPGGATFGWRPPAVKIAGTAGRPAWSIYSDQMYVPFPDNLHWFGDEKKPKSLWALNSVRILMPDRMPCLVSWYPDAMPIDRRKGTDPMPIKGKTILKETRP